MTRDFPPPPWQRRGGSKIVFFFASKKKNAGQCSLGFLKFNFENSIGWNHDFSTGAWLYESSVYDKPFKPDLRPLKDQFFFFKIWSFSNFFFPIKTKFPSKQKNSIKTHINHFIYSVNWFMTIADYFRLPLKLFLAVKLFRCVANCFAPLKICVRHFFSIW